MSVPNCPTVSVVVCAFNEERILARCLNGLAEQNYPKESYEIIVIDDESTDSTPEVAIDRLQSMTTMGTRSAYFRIEHGGLSIARNTGIRRSRAEIVAFIDGDAIPSKDWLTELVKPFAEGADFVGGRIDLLNDESVVARFLQRSRNRQFFGPRVFNDQCIGCNMAFRRALFDKATGFHENFTARGDESTLCQRIRGFAEFGAAPAAVVLHERPATIGEAIRTEWKSATLVPLIARAADAPTSPKQALLLVEQALIAVLPILLLLLWFWPVAAAILLSISGLAALRRMVLRPLNQRILASLISDYGIVRGVVGHVLFCYCQSSLAIAGRVVGSWKYSTTPIIPPMSTNVAVLRQIDNRPACAPCAGAHSP